MRTVANPTWAASSFALALALALAALWAVPRLMSLFAAHPACTLACALVGLLGRPFVAVTASAPAPSSLFGRESADPCLQLIDPNGRFFVRLFFVVAPSSAPSSLLLSRHSVKPTFGHLAVHLPVVYLVLECLLEIVEFREILFVLVFLAFLSRILWALSQALMSSSCRRPL